MHTGKGLLSLHLPPTPTFSARNTPMGTPLASPLGVCVCVRERERERERVCVCERERERERERESVCVCVSVCA